MSPSNQPRRSAFKRLFASLVQNYLDEVDVKLDGDRKGDIQIKNDRVFWNFFTYASGINRAAMGESYVNGDWDTDDLEIFLEKAWIQLLEKDKNIKLFFRVLNSFPLLFFNMQSKKQCKKDISSHYDIGNDLFKLMLDKSMNYSCAYWQKNVFLKPLDDSSELKSTANTLCDTLDEAQMNKMLLIARKLNLKPGMKVLDIGCGWGYLAKFLAINFDVHVVGVTISKEQIEYANANDLEPKELDFLRVPNLKPTGTGKFEFLLMDYRDVKGTFDRIVSVGMIEHVGAKNYDTFFKVTYKYLKDDGLFLLHTIGVGHPKVPSVDPWANKYIFPGGMLPRHTQLVKATLGKFLIEDWHNLNINYCRTLACWRDNFEKSWPQLEHKYDERFKRMWILFLSASIVLFKTRATQLYQIVLSKNYGIEGGYVSCR